MDVDADADADIDGGGVFADALTFFHLGEVPVMILASFLIFFFWITTMLSNHYLNPTLSFVVTLYCLIPNLLISLILTKAAVMPLVPLFRSMNSNEKLELVGRQATVSTSHLDGKFGQVSIEQDGPPIVVNAQTETGQRLQKNDLVRIKKFIQETGVYIVEPDKSEKS